MSENDENLTSRRHRPRLHLVLGPVLTAVLVVGGLWFVLERRAERDAQVDREREGIFAAVLAGKDEDLAAAAARSRELSAELAAARTREQELDVRVTRLAAQVEALAAENLDLRASQKGFDELRDDRGRLAGDLARVEDELASARRELRKAQEELAAAGERETAPSKEAPAAVPEDEPATPDPVPAGAVTDAKELDRVKTVLNRLLAETGGAWRFEKIGGLRGKVLYGVEIVEGQDDARGAKTLEARRARIAIDAARKRVEIRLSGGTITYYGVRARFPDDRYVLPLTDVATESWVRSGLTIFATI